VTFRLAVQQLGFYNRDMAYVVEPGEVEVLVGSSSQDVRARERFTIVGVRTDVSRDKVFFCAATVE
jgi:beta-glucosidase